MTEDTNQSTPEVTRALKPCPFCGGTLVKSIAYAGKQQHPENPTWWAGCTKCDAGIDAVGEQSAIAAWNTRTPARGGDELREALEEARGHLEYLAGRFPAGTTPDLIAKIDTLLASTDMAGASVPDRLARRMGAEFVARDDVPPVEGLTSGEGWQPIETAPKDGSWFIADGGGLDRPTPMKWCGRVGAWECDAVMLEDWDQQAEGYSRPLFWLAIPSRTASPKATATASVRELLAEVKLSIECAAGCDEGVDPDTASSEVMSFGGSSLAVAYDKVCASLTDSGTAATIGGERA